MNLDNLTKETIQTIKFPIEEILENSAFYPGCAFDGDLVRCCNIKMPELNINSFIYVDYGVDKKTFEENKNSFNGYHIVGSRYINHYELTPNGLILTPSPNIDEEEYKRKIHINLKEVFINWTVYERNDDKEENFGVKRFCILYLRGEGVATFQALYWSNKKFPKVFALINAKPGYGGNFEDPRNRDSELANIIMNNPHGQPEYVFYTWDTSSLAGFNWEEYNNIRRINQYYSYEPGTNLFIYKLKK